MSSFFSTKAVEFSLKSSFAVLPLLFQESTPNWATLISTLPRLSILGFFPEFPVFALRLSTTLIFLLLLIKLFEAVFAESLARSITFPILSNIHDPIV
ncbi:hypothetical protein AX774_g1917 [Zancudomyces culisetae]|uniref:Uncharacterized protein n=1 Tax=Zancudomyces culisetae TaxID=1213189 RepID=A0A1R1PU67_ZANCU|nr:hypothetical protein AX774_g1917 [Zancudomyces culisetae]|eukprot:OMH84546.1 hypothetical protein AX774_g1917 [Zancudomyces culisetae]